MAPLSPKPSCASSPKSVRRSPPSPGSTSSVVRHPRNNQRAERVKSIRETLARAYTSEAYLCTYCGKRFCSPQALGGHQNAHHREKKLKRENLLCPRPIPSNPPSLARSDACQLNPDSVQYSMERNLTSQPNFYFKETGIARPCLSNPMNEPNTVARYTVPLSIKIPSFPFCFDHPRGKNVPMTFVPPGQFSPSFPSSGFDPKGNTALQAFTPLEKFSSLSDPSIAARNFFPTWNPCTSEGNLVPRLTESVPTAIRNPRLVMAAPLPSGGNNGGRTTYHLLGALAAHPAKAAGGVGDGGDSGPMGLDLDLHL